MLTKIGRTTFKCNQCGHVFDSIYTEDGFIAKTNFPHCPKCGSENVRKTTFIDKLLNKMK